MSAFQKETVLSVRHWTESLFSFTATRDPGFRFQNGQFAMIGLEVEGKPLMRAYSMASANHEEALEFFSIWEPQVSLSKADTPRASQSTGSSMEREPAFFLESACVPAPTTEPGALSLQPSLPIWHADWRRLQR